MTRVYETILIPTDGSDGTERAIEHAIDLAETYGATVHVLYVVDTSYPYGDFDVSFDWNAVVEELRGEGERAVSGVIDSIEAAGVEAVAAIRESENVPRAILAYADEAGVDMIVMGTHGRTGLNRVILGSVTERVVRTSRIPVLTVQM